jgi:hypothetical protein
MTMPTTTASRARRRNETILAIANGVVDVHREPNARSELVTQALLGVPAVILKTDPSGWTRVRLVDYEGWVESAKLAVSAEPGEVVAVVSVPRAPLYRHGAGAAIREEVYVTTVLPVLDPAPISPAGRIPVALPNGEDGWLAAKDTLLRPTESPFPLYGSDIAIALAHDLMRTPYLWGGVTVRGIDCSGLTQLVCRMGGAIIPRDGDQQYAALDYIVARADVRRGDLVYFADHGAITHVALALDNMTILHANGYDARVAITSLDPQTSEYSATLVNMYAGARRPFPEETDAETEQN